jgi:hypothetical protein
MCRYNIILPMHLTAQVHSEALVTPGVVVMRFDAPLFFANTAFIKVWDLKKRSLRIFFELTFLGKAEVS